MPRRPEVPPPAASAAGPIPDKPNPVPPPPPQQGVHNARFAGAPNIRQEAFDEPSIAPPRISRFELKAGLAVLILFLGGGIYWWSSQNDSRLAELALTAAAPAQSAFRAVADSTPNPPKAPEPLPAQAEAYAPAAQPVSEPAAPAPNATPVAPSKTALPEAAPKAKSSKHKNTRRRRAENEERLAAAPEVVPEPQVTAQPLEKRRPNLRELVASCRRMQLFEGERCLWRLCDGKWGKDGCPSYN
jgi:hypothetical protein